MAFQTSETLRLHYACRGSFDSTARVWDADRGQCLYVLDRCIDIVYSLSFTPWDGKYLALGSNDGRVCVYRVKVGFFGLLKKHAIRADTK